MMRETGMENPNKVFYPTSCLESYIHKNKISISSNNDNTNKGYNLGGLNIMGENKRYENLKHFDVKSMYPNILISLQASSNLDYLNLKCSTVKELT
jgi:DNA polymerase elongation subunit (family B)